MEQMQILADNSLLLIFNIGGTKYGQHYKSNCYTISRYVTDTLVTCEQYRKDRLNSRWYDKGRGIEHGTPAALQVERNKFIASVRQR
jgi:hypothetical protein